MKTYTALFVEGELPRPSLDGVTVNLLVIGTTVVPWPSGMRAEEALVAWRQGLTGEV